MIWIRLMSDFFPLITVFSVYGLIILVFILIAKKRGLILMRENNESN